VFRVVAIADTPPVALARVPPLFANPPTGELDTSVDVPGFPPVMGLGLVAPPVVAATVDDGDAMPPVAAPPPTAELAEVMPPTPPPDITGVVLVTLALTPPVPATAAAPPVAALLEPVSLEPPHAALNAAVATRTPSRKTSFRIHNLKLKHLMLLLIGVSFTHSRPDSVYLLSPLPFLPPSQNQSEVNVGARAAAGRNVCWC
jgi:hypothetical protein